MSISKIDKVSFGLAVVALVLLIYGWCVFQNYIYFNSFLMHYIAGLLEIINPSSVANTQTIETEGFYVSEERSILLIFMVSFFLSFSSFLKLVFGKIKGSKVQTYASTFTFSLVVTLANIYIVLRSGLLMDV